MSGWDKLDILLHFALLSMLAVGGAMSMVSDINRLLVDERGLLTAVQFGEAIALAQAVPGPNVLFVTLLGWQSAGLTGAILATVGLLAPSSLITYYANRWRSGNLETRAVRAIRLGLSPIAIGLTLAAGWVIATGAVHHWAHAVLCGVAVLVSLRTKINPLWLIGLGALLGPFVLP